MIVIHNMSSIFTLQTRCQVCGLPHGSAHIENLIIFTSVRHTRQRIIQGRDLEDPKHVDINDLGIA